MIFNIKKLYIPFSALFLLSAPAIAAEKDSSKEPIEITADELEVFRIENKAIFTGTVEAVQGEMKLNADKMTVFYAQNNNDNNEKSTPSSPSAGSSNSIERIKATGKVFLSTPSETAQGNYGDYDLNTKTIKLNEEVVLTKGKNVVKGDFFVYNQETGHSKVWSTGATKTNSATGENNKAERVRSIFVPKDDTESE